MVPGNASVTLTLQADEPIAASLQVDGQHRAHLREGDTVTVSRAPEEVRLIRMREIGFFDLVHQKLIEWSR